MADRININPIVIHDVAKGFPDIPFIIPHIDCSYPTELLQLLRACAIIMGIHPAVMSGFAG